MLGWLDGCDDGSVEILGWRDGWLDEEGAEELDGCVLGWLDGCDDGSVEMVGWIDGWLDEEGAKELVGILLCWSDGCSSASCNDRASSMCSSRVPIQDSSL